VRRRRHDPASLGLLAFPFFRSSLFFCSVNRVIGWARIFSAEPSSSFFSLPSSYSELLSSPFLRRVERGQVSANEDGLLFPSPLPPFLHLLFPSRSAGHVCLGLSGGRDAPLFFFPFSRQFFFFLFELRPERYMIGISGTDHKNFDLGVCVLCPPPFFSFLPPFFFRVPHKKKNARMRLRIPPFILLLFFFLDPPSSFIPPCGAFFRTR